MRAIELCAGAGGSGLGWHAAGWTTLGVELDVDAVTTHRARVGPCEHADIRDWHPPPGTWDVTGGGVPCETFSQAGAKAGTSDAKGRLHLEIPRVGEEAGARVVWLENVQGLKWTRNAAGWTGLAEIIDAWERRGWQVRARLFNCADFGVPQARKRILIVGTREPAFWLRWQWPAPTHAPPGDLFLPPHRTVRTALGLALDRPSPCITAGEGRSSANRGARGGHARGRKGTERLADLMDRPSPTVVAGGTRTGGNAYFGHRSRVEFEGAIRSVLDAPAATVIASEGMYSADSRGYPKAGELIAAALARAGLLDRPSTTVCTTADVEPAGNHARQRGKDSVVLPVAAIAALQGFPPGFVFAGSVTSQYRQAGRAIPPALAEAFARSIAHALEAA